MKENKNLVIEAGKERVKERAVMQVREGAVQLGAVFAFSGACRLKQSRHVSKQ